MAKNLRVSDTMGDALAYLAYGVYRAHLEPERRTLTALERRGLIVWSDAAELGATGERRVHDTTKLWDTTPAGWSWLAANMDKGAYDMMIRKLDAGRLSLEGALEEAYADAEYDAWVEAIDRSTPRRHADAGRLRLEEALEEAYPAPKKVRVIVRSVGQRAVSVAMKPEGTVVWGPEQLFPVDMPLGHGVRTGDTIMVMVTSEGLHFVDEFGSIIRKEDLPEIKLDEPVYGSKAAVLGEALRLTEQHDAARIQEAEMFSRLSPRQQEKVARTVETISGTMVDFTGISGPGSGPGTEAWRARLENTKVRQLLKDAPAPEELATDVRSKDTVWVADATGHRGGLWPIEYMGVQIPRDLQDDWNGVRALSWCRGIVAHWASGYKQRG